MGALTSKTNTEVVPSDSKEIVIKTNPLFMDTVLRSLFNIVDHSTLKECRLVCTKWKSISDPLLIKRSAFVVRITTYRNDPTTFRSPLAIPSLFKSIKQFEVRFIAFKFECEILRTNILEMYLEPNKMLMTHLNIVGNEIISSSPNINHLIGPNLVKLKLISGMTRWVLFLEKLVTILQVDLTNCSIIDTNAKVKMCPQELKLVDCDCNLSKGVETGFKYQLSQVIDFRSLKKLEINCRFGLANSYLSLSDCVNVKILRIFHLTINLNGKISPEELALGDNGYEVDGKRVSSFLLNDYLNSTQFMKVELNGMQISCNFGIWMEFRELEIEAHVPIRERPIESNVRKLIIKPTCHTINPDIINLALLPKTLEYLDICCYPPNSLVCLPLVSFPNLKQLVIRACPSEILVHFQKSTSLVYITLDYKYFSSKFRSINTIPSNIKGLILIDVDGRRLCVDNTAFTRKKVLKLEILVLSFTCDSHLERIVESFKSLTKIIKADVVVVYKIPAPGPTYLREKNIKDLMALKRAMPSIKVAFGPFYWESEDVFQNSMLFGLVDKTSEYYYFEGQRGRGISKLELSKMIPVDLS